MINTVGVTHCSAPTNRFSGPAARGGTLPSSTSPLTSRTAPTYSRPTLPTARHLHPFGKVPHENKSPTAPRQGFACLQDLQTRPAPVSNSSKPSGFVPVSDDQIGGLAIFKTPNRPV